MKLRSWVRLFAKITLTLTFVVIIAGSIVRMTGSGMGCPDWPKCFGHLIPPTDAEELSYSPGKSFSEGQMIIMNDTLWVAERDITSSVQFERSEWHKYPKHDYAVFNVLHTWVEYINRLATVVYGIPVFILSLLCLILLIREKDWRIFLLAFLTDIMVGYEVWLGKLVVDGNLKENSITYHMFGSVAIVALLLVMVYRLREKREAPQVEGNFRLLLFAMMAMAFFQVMLGTQVREEVDAVARLNADRSLWIEQLPAVFKIHRSFSILVSLVALAIAWYHSKMTARIAQVNLMLALVFLEILVGVVLSYFSMPAAMQPTHLLLGVMLFAASFYSVLMTLGSGSHAQS
jgi:cytochrome c oxidase assembly protein subunit 15